AGDGAAGGVRADGSPPVRMRGSLRRVRMPDAGGAAVLMAASLRQRARARFDRWARRRAPATLPVRLNHRRIYVLPTRFGTFFGALLLTMGLGALNYNNNPALMLCLILLGAAIASLVQAQLQLTGLEIHSIGA